MDFLRATTVEGNYPPMRRKNKAKTDNFMKTIGESFLTFFQQSVQLKPPPTLKESEEAIQEHYKKIHEIIDAVDQHLTRRLQNHENEVFSIVKEEIEDMRAETNKIVERLNQAIKDKNTDDEIWKLSNELDYFKSQTYKLFKENKQVREEMKLLRRQIKEYQIELQNSDRVMQKLKRKNMKFEHTRCKAKTQLESNMSMQTLKPQVSEFKVKNFLKSTGKVLKTEPIEPQKSQEMTGQSIINIKVDSKAPRAYPQAHMITEIDEIDPLHESWTNPSEIIDKKLGISNLPPVQFAKVESIEYQSQKESLRRVDQWAQTEEVGPKPEEKLAAVEVKHFSRTDGMKQASGKQLKKQKNIDLLKSGFHVKLYNQKSSTVNSPMEGLGPSSPPARQTRHNRYMTNALNKNKIAEQSWAGRRSGIRSTMK